MIEKIGNMIPAIEDPAGAVEFKKRLFWTGAVIAVYLLLSNVQLFGIAPEAIQRFSIFETLLGSTLGTIATLGIGPIVTASIIIQLLIGSEIIKWDLKNPADREKFTASQKILTIILSVVEATAYVMFGGLSPIEHTSWMTAAVILQITAGSIIIMYLDEIMQKYGIGSGISLFIALGVSKTIFVRLLSPFKFGTDMPAGILYQIFYYLGQGDFVASLTALIPVIATIVVFMIVVYAQDIEVEIPLAFGSVSGFTRRWPLKFIYTSNMPVILLAAFMANMRFIGQAMASKGITWFAQFSSNGAVTGGLLYYLTPPRTLSVEIIMLSTGAAILAALLYMLFTKKSHKFMWLSIPAGFIAGLAIAYFTVGLPAAEEWIRMATYMLFFSAGSVLFSWMWVITSGMDAESVAKQIESIGMQIPGFRRDSRIVERVLDRYIGALTTMGGAFVGVLAAFADFTNALGTGTGILLTAMIIFNFYETILYRYLKEMDPRLRKFFKQ